MHIVQYITVHVLVRKPELVQAVLGDGNYNYAHCTIYYSACTS